MAAMTCPQREPGLPQRAVLLGGFQGTRPRWDPPSPPLAQRGQAIETDHPSYRGGWHRWKDAWHRFSAGNSPAQPLVHWVRGGDCNTSTSSNRDFTPVTPADSYESAKRTVGVVVVVVGGRLRFHPRENSMKRMVLWEPIGLPCLLSLSLSPLLVPCVTRSRCLQATS